MLKAGLVAVLAGILIQVSNAKRVPSVRLDQQIGEIDDDLYSRYVEAKSGDAEVEGEAVMSNDMTDIVVYPPIYPQPSDIQRKQSVRVRGFFITHLEDFKRVLLVPFLWAWDVLWMPINFSKTAKMWWDFRAEKKAELKQA